jgi:hypothetical protein
MAPSCHVWHERVGHSGKPPRLKLPENRADKAIWRLWISYPLPDPYRG